jgi:hypothetical protein
MKNVTYTVSIAPEDIPVRGNCQVSGDDALDKAAEDEVLERLYRGDDRAWCVVKVTAKLDDYSGTAYLGCCSLDDTYTAEQCAEDHGMKDEALADLQRTLALAVQSGERAAKLLEGLS